MNKLTNVTIGADIEVFLQNKLTKEIISAEGLIKGTKDVPFNYDPSNKYFATSLDNVLAEFCIPPATNKAEFYNYIRKSLAYINNSIPKEYCTSAFPSYSLDSKWLCSKHSQEFGCQPDFNAYTRTINRKPDCENKNLRSAGGHIHVGFANPDFKYDPNLYEGDKALLIYTGDEQRCNIIKSLDLFVGVPSVIIEPDNERKELYGKAGCFRPKSYGVEYRTVSNFYLQSKKLIIWLYDAVMSAISFYNSGNRIDDILGDYIGKIINNNDKSSAQEIIKEFNLKLV